MKLVFTYLSVMLAVVVFANEQAFEDGNASYEAGDFKSAIDQYGIAIGAGEYSTELFYNLGNAYYRNEELGKAIWAYESALKIDPDHEDAIFNLSFVNAQTVDNIDIKHHGFGHWLKSLIFTSNINLWAIISIAGSLLLSLFGMLFLSANSKRLKNVSLLISSLTLVITVSSFIAANLHKSQLSERKQGIIVSDQVDILVAPVPDSNLSYKLSEGSKVELISTEKDWLQIELNGNKGWVLKSDLWEI